MMFCCIQLFRVLCCVQSSLWPMLQILNLPRTNNLSTLVDPNWIISKAKLKLCHAATNNFANYALCSSCDIVVHFVKLSRVYSECWLKVKLIEKLKLLHSTLPRAQPWLWTNSQYLAKSKQNVHKYNQKYFYYLPNKLCSLSQNEFERIIFNEVILQRFSGFIQWNRVKISFQAFRKSP